MRRLQANGTIIAYARSGTGPPIVLMHGAEADHSMFATLVAQLEKRLTVIACDQRASGDTCKSHEPYTLEDTGDDAAALIEGLGFEKAHVYGTSLGSLIAQSLAVRHPERVDRLVLAAAIRIGRTLVLGDVRARQCNPGPRVGRAGDLSVSGGGPTASN